MDSDERKSFASLAKKLIENHRDIIYSAITVKKENVRQNIRQDQNKLYNYMIRLLLARKMAKFERVIFIPDERSVKVASGNSLHDYLQTTLWFDLNAKTVLQTTPSESSSTLNIQFADMLAGLVQSYHEDKANGPYRILGPYIQSKTLFF